MTSNAMQASTEYQIGKYYDIQLISYIVYRSLKHYLVQFAGSIMYTYVLG